MSLRNLARKWPYGVLAAGVGVGAVVHADAEPRGPSFDPEALERGAKALREINASPHARKVIDLSKQQEVTKQQELKSKEAEFRAAAEQASIEREKLRWDEQRKTLQADARLKAELAQYEDELARKRMQSEHELNRQRNAELVQMQEEGNRRQEAERRRISEQIEAERRATEKYKAELEKEVRREQALAEAEGRTREARENEDVNRRTLQLRMEEERKKLVEAINVTFSHLGSGVTSVLTDERKLLALVGGATLLALGVYTSKEATRVSARALERWFGTPKLIRETSRRPFWWQRGASPAANKTLEEVKRDFSDIVLPGTLHDQVRSLANVTSNTRRHGAPFRHMLFYGPPGTGKTMAAKRLARTSGLDYAIMSGGDVAPLGGAAVTQIHEMFDWAERSRKGLLLFIDEADAFMARRGNVAMSEGLRAALNAMLFRTGDQSRDFAVVLATNRPGDLDEAVVDRMDEALMFGLPGAQERLKILRLYLDQYLVKAGTAAGGAGSGAPATWGQRLLSLLKGQKASAEPIRVQPDVDEALLQQAAQDTAGFSGRELAKLVASVQAAVYGAHEPVLTAAMFRSVVAHKVREHAHRRAFAEGHHTPSHASLPREVWRGRAPQSMGRG